MYKRKAIKKHFFAIARKYMLMAGDSVYRPIVQFCLKIYISFCVFYPWNEARFEILS